MSALSSTPLTACLNEALARETGLYFSAGRLPQLEEFLARSFTASDCAGLSSAFCSEPWSLDQVRCFARRLTISETGFFRDPRVFAALRDELLPALIAARRSRRSLSVWSAGCASGEELYSVAILLRTLLPPAAGWDLRLLGTDINPDVIARARESVYGNWSFREAPPTLRWTCFDPVAGNAWRLKSEYRSMVRWNEQNLVRPGAIEAVLPVPDLIFCRNVLMYFHPGQAVAVLRRMASVLPPDGILIVGPSELHLAEQAGLRMVHSAGVYFFTPPVAPESSVRAGVMPPPQPARGLQLRRDRTAPSPLRPPGTSRKPFPGPESPPSPAPGRFELLLDQALAHAGRGDLDEACRSAELAATLLPLHPAAHVVLGMILHEQGDPSRARQALKRALFLDDLCALAWFHLGLLALRERDFAAARGHLRQALQRLARTPSAILLSAPGLPSPVQLDSMIRTALCACDNATGNVLQPEETSG